MQYLSYEDVVGRQSMFKYVIENDLMSPWCVDPNTGPWIYDVNLTSKEKAMLLKWIEKGALKVSKPSRHLWIEKTQSKTINSYTVHLPKKK